MDKLTNINTAPRVSKWEHVLLILVGVDEFCRQGATIHDPITEVKQPWARSILGWVTIWDTMVAAKNMIDTCQRTYVGHWDMLNHYTSIYHKWEWVCVCVVALKVIVTRYTTQNVMQTCMLPRELIWERLAPFHAGMTQESDWPWLTDFDWKHHVLLVWEKRLLA